MVIPQTQVLFVVVRIFYELKILFNRSRAFRSYKNIFLSYEMKKMFKIRFYILLKLYSPRHRRTKTFSRTYSAN